MLLSPAYPSCYSQPASSAIRTASIRFLASSLATAVSRSRGAVQPRVCFRSLKVAAADRWIWIVIAAHTQLRLARPLASDLRRPWEKPLDPEHLTPARVRRGFRNLRAKIPTPARAPKPTRPGPGRPPGSRNRQRATVHDVGRVLATGEAYTRAAHHQKGAKPR